MMLECDAFFGDCLVCLGDFYLTPVGAERAALVSDTGGLLFVRSQLGLRLRNSTFGALLKISGCRPKRPLARGAQSGSNPLTCYSALRCREGQLSFLANVESVP